MTHAAFFSCLAVSVVNVYLMVIMIRELKTVCIVTFMLYTTNLALNKVIYNYLALLLKSQ